MGVGVIRFLFLLTKLEVTLHVTTASPIRGFTFCFNPNNMSVLLIPCHKVLQNYVHSVHTCLNVLMLNVLTGWSHVVVLEPWVE